MRPLFKGTATAIVTPFRNGVVDYDAFGKLIDLQLAAGIKALVVCGTTGEPSTMTEEERLSVIDYSVKKVNGAVPIIAGTGSNCTANVIAFANKAAALGVAAQLVVTPYYNKCTQNGLIAHYTAIKNATTLPIIAYNVPSRTGVNLAPATVKALRDAGVICAVKEASGDLRQISTLCELATDDFCIYSGDDPYVYPVLSLGGMGVISVASNVAPKQFVDLCDLYFDGKADEARTIQFRSDALVRALFSEVNPIPVKCALSMMGLIDNELRLPLTPMEEQNATKLREVMIAYGITL